MQDIDQNDINPTLKDELDVIRGVRLGVLDSLAKDPQLCLQLLKKIGYSSDTYSDQELLEQLKFLLSERKNTVDSHQHRETYTSNEINELNGFLTD